jgi:cytochrome c-type biogenesis protein CcmH
MKRALAAVMLVACAAAFADEAGTANEARYRALINELRCLVCQNQNIADSNAPLAQDLREQVRSQLAAGKTDREITDYMTARYGDFVLYRPQFKATTALLWLAPATLVAIGGLVAFRMARRRSAGVPTPVDQEKLARILRDVQKGSP